MSGSAAGHMTQGPSEQVLGSSIPSDSTNLATDEYVIITRSDTRPKHALKGPSSSGEVPSFPEGDDYEQMNPVKSQILLSHSSHYNTPNPSLYHNGEGASVTQGSVAMATAATEEVGGASGHLYGNVERTDQDFSNLDRAARLGDKPLVRAQTLPPRRKTVSSSSVDSEVFVTSSQSSSVSGPTSIPEDERKLVPIASPESESSVQRLRSCSNDSYLENGAEKPKRHSYVNVPGDGTEQNKPSAEPVTESSQPGPPKKPKPFPRSSLLRSESEENK